MSKRTRRPALFLALLIGFSTVLAGLSLGCPNSPTKCEEICSWWSNYCTGESHQSCLDDCAWADESASSVLDRCVAGNGWGTPSNCQSASCCLHFVYWEEQYTRQCL